MGFSKFTWMALLVLVFCILIWILGKEVLARLIWVLLWASSALTVCVGIVVVVDAKGRPMGILAGLLLWAFAAYMVKVAVSLCPKK
jgi:hypothetical protein